MQWVWGFLKSAIRYSAWCAAAIFAAGAIIYVLNENQRLPFVIPETWTWVVGIAAIVYGAIAVFDFVSWLINKSGSQTKNRQRKSVLRYLDTLSYQEREILAYLLARNQTSFQGSMDGGYTQPLVAKGLLMRSDQYGKVDECTYVIPDYVWKELRRRPREFRDTFKGNVHPWRVPWSVHP